MKLIDMPVPFDVDSGLYEMCCLPLCLVACDGAPARVVLRQS